MKYLYLNISLVAVFVTGFLFDEFEGVMWFLGKATLSSAAVLSALCFETKVSLKIAILETFFVICTILASIGYLTDYFLWYYKNYITILEIVCGIEVAILLYGVPWHGAYRSISRLANRYFNDHTRDRLCHVNRFESLS